MSLALYGCLLFGACLSQCIGQPVIADSCTAASDCGDVDDVASFLQKTQTREGATDDQEPGEAYREFLKAAKRALSAAKESRNTLAKAEKATLRKIKEEGKLMNEARATAAKIKTKQIGLKQGSRTLAAQSAVVQKKLKYIGTKTFKAALKANKAQLKQTAKKLKDDRQIVKSQIDAARKARDKAVLDAKKQKETIQKEGKKVVDSLAKEKAHLEKQIATARKQEAAKGKYIVNQTVLDQLKLLKDKQQIIKGNLTAVQSTLKNADAKHHEIMKRLDQHKLRLDALHKMDANLKKIEQKQAILSKHAGSLGR